MKDENQNPEEGEVSGKRKPFQCARWSKSTDWALVRFTREAKEINILPFPSPLYSPELHEARRSRNRHWIWKIAEHNAQ